MMSKLRLDQALVARHFHKTRARAADAIRRGTVRVNGVRANKAGLQIGPDDRLEVDDPARQYVSRGALKLLAGLSATSFSPKGRNALDLGASTGGFTQVLLEAGAEYVFAIDVGHGQMADEIAGNPRVCRLDRTNARELAKAPIDRPIGCVVSDLSFISLKTALPPALALAAPDAWGLFLVKPQFEVGPDHVGKNGVVADRQLAAACAVTLQQWLDVQPGWRSVHLSPSPVRGGSGNTEFLLGGRKDRVEQ